MQKHQVNSIRTGAEECPCGSVDRATAKRLSYAECCMPLHQGQAAATPEALMRSRYSANAMNNAEYLSQTWDSSTRPKDLQLDPTTLWCQLVVVDSNLQGDQGEVEFCATFKQEKSWHCLRERSRFVRREGRWYYLDGDAKWEKLNPSRNGECPCGSGKKFKRCCM